MNLTSECLGSWVLIDLGLGLGKSVGINELDKGSLTNLCFACGTNVGILGDMGLPIIHNSSTRVRWAVREALLVPWGLR